ncbi:MAG: UDP-N-acetylmuramate--L-alanine ligase [Verrucomicrobiales bacterium]|nr:UDP-N-acetylmuramate--L-alanine ligase [Verrucomicrobiales bacterium]
MNQAILSVLQECQSPMRINLIGVAGSGMSGLASLLLALGHKVSGSDRATTTETTRLERRGLQFFGPHSEREVEGCDLVIYSTAIQPSNIAYQAAEKQGIPLVRRAEALAAVMRAKQGVVVAGTHGKTTTSALTAHVLRQGGKHPSHYVGAEIPILGSNALWDAEGELFVAEGDESDGSLVHFHPAHTIILNIEAEHLDHYEDLDAIKAVFHTLLSQTTGHWIYCAEDAGAVSVCAGHPRAIGWGWHGNPHAAYTAEILEANADHSLFRARHQTEVLGEFTLGIPGRHNVSNALSALALAHQLGVELSAIGSALKSFRGAKRRFEVRYQSERFTLIDDYGHHPSEIAATLATAQGLDPQRILCLFQPHRYSRTQLLKKEFGVAFGPVDELFVTDIYAASEKPLPGVSGETIVDAVRAASETHCHFTPHLLEARDRLGNAVHPGDLVITLGAGNVHEVARSLARDLPVLDQIWSLLDEHGGGKARLYEPMSLHTTFRVGGPAQFWIEPITIAGLAALVRYLRAASIPIRVIGRGSNLLVQDGGIRGAVIHPSKGEFDSVTVEGENLIAGVGARLKKIASAARNAGLGGFEWMEGIPGNLGGAIRMNAGAMGTETFDQIVSVRYIDLDGSIQEKGLEDIRHHYRNVPEFEERLIVSAVLKGQPNTAAEEIDSKLAASHQKRRTSQPVGASAGCVFKNPEACGAGQLIDQLGLKGRSVGRARVSDVHGNFIVNVGGATAREILDLISEIQATALEQRGIQLDLEVRVIGESQPLPL